MVLNINNLSVEYGKPANRSGQGHLTRAVRNANLSVAPGEILAILGPSGCGKSSILRAVAGLVPPSSGSISWDSQDLAGVPTHTRGFGLMFQEGQLFSHYNVAQNVAFGLRTAASQKLPRTQRAQVVAEMLELVGLAGYEKRRVETLSGGQQQRVALARALAPNPRVLLLDEPLSSLDRPLREELSVQIRAIIRQRGCAAIYVTHDLDEAFTVADHVAVMDAGQVLQQGPAMQVWRHPVSAHVAQFLGYQLFDDGTHHVAVAPGDLVAHPADLVAHPGEQRETEATGDQANGEAGSLGDGILGTGVVVGTGLWRGTAVVVVQIPDGRRVHALPATDAVASEGTRVQLRSRGGMKF